MEPRTRLQSALEIAASITPAEFGHFREHIDPSWVEEALVATGTATVRRRRLPAEQVVWLVVGMALMRNESIERVLAWLNLALPVPSCEPMARSAITQARQRLGEEPMAYLFARTAAEWGVESAERLPWRGLALYGMDGSTLRLPDSPENWREFGGQKGNGIRNGSAYPTARVVALMALRSHLLLNLEIGSYGTGETTLAKGLWQEIPDHSLTIVDRNFFVYEELSRLQESGTRHWMCRPKKNFRWRVVRKLGAGDALVELEPSRKTRKSAPNLPATWTARAIRYHRRGFRPGVLLTSLVDSHCYPAAEIAALYHERWELELGYDEIKTHLLAREETIRSRTPSGVRQELWGIGLAYNLVRLEMERAADEAGVEPIRISFVNALSLIRNAWLLWSTPPLAPGRIPADLVRLRSHLKLLVLPERRHERSYPRAVKLKMSPYLLKRPAGRPAI